MSMDKMKKEIVVVARDKLFGDDAFQGFKEHHECDFSHKIHEHKKCMVRGPAEEDPSHKQLVGYAIVYHEPSKRIFAYQRHTDRTKFTESRLSGKWSFGLGGHTDAEELVHQDPVESALRRELDEELHIKEYTIHRLGYINDDSNHVGSVHFGVAFLIKTNDDDVRKKGEEALQGRLMTKDEIKEILIREDCDVETWSELCWPILLKIIDGQ